MFVRFYSYFFACFFLVLHVDVRPWIISNQHHSQSGDQSPTSLQPLHLFFDLFLHLFSDSFTVYDRRHDLLRPETEKNLYRKRKFCKDATFYWHDMEPSKGQPPKFVEQRREIYARDQQIPLIKTLEFCKKKTSLYLC